MHKKTLFYTLLAIICIISGWLLFQFHSKPQGDNNATPEPAAKQSNKSAVENVATLKQVSSNAQLQAVSVNKPLPNSVERIQRALESKNIPIQFYGMVIDQNSNALSGVKVNVSIRHWELSENAESTVIRIERKTDAKGRFEINGATGDGFDIASIQKDGYELEPGQRSYGAVGGSFDSPVIFKMWNTNIHERLISAEKKFDIVPDGRPYIIDFTAGTIAESGVGDLKAWIKRSNNLIGRNYDWSFWVQAVDGGLVEELNQYDAMFLAPETDYTNIFSGNFPATNQDWGDSMFRKRFFIKARNGQIYGRMEIEVFSSYGNTGQGRLMVNYTVNPSGSHILR